MGLGAYTNTDGDGIHKIGGFESPEKFGDQLEFEDFE